jgi:dihydrofolate reductase
MLVSLDGYARDASGSFDWARPSDELHAFVNAQERAVGTYVYGRGLWEVMRYWQDPPTGGGAAPVHDEYAAIWQAKDKVIVSTTLQPPPEPRTELWDDFDAGRLAAVVRSSDADVSIGGPTLAGHALRAGLVDEITAYVVPHVAGGGLPWLPDGYEADLILREHRAVGSGAQALVYDVVR